MATMASMSAYDGPLGPGVPRLALEIVRHSAHLAELLEAWGNVLAELPPITAYFRELEFVRAAELGGDRNDLPVGPILDSLCELIDRAVTHPHVLLVGSTSRPDTLRPAFALPGRFERVVGRRVAFDSDIEIGAVSRHEEQVDCDARSNAVDLALSDKASFIRQLAHVALVEHVVLEHRRPALGLVEGVDVATNDRGVVGRGGQLEVVARDPLVDHHRRDRELRVLVEQRLAEGQVDQAGLDPLAEDRRRHHRPGGDRRREERWRGQQLELLVGRPTGPTDGSTDRADGWGSAVCYQRRRLLIIT